MNKNPKQSQAIAYLRQLCCLGLNKEIVIPEFLRAVRAVIPSDNNMFTGLDEHYLPAYHLPGFAVSEIAELPIEVVTRFFTPERMKCSLEWFSRHPVLTDPFLWDKAFYLSDAYNLVWRHCGHYHFVFAPIKQSGKPVGLLGLFRPPRQHQPFNSHEQALLPHLTAYVSHALGMRGGVNIQYCDNGASGMMVMNNAGTIISLCPEAKRLLTLARYPALTVGMHSLKDELPTKLAQLCQNLDVIFQGKAAAPPSWSFTNAHGRFVFRAYWLDKQNHEPGGFIGMTIEHQEPLPLKILRALRDSPLSPVQKEVALLLAQGFSNEEIGERLGIKLTTVKDHVGKIFVKLDIDHREELLPNLRALDSSMLTIKIW